MALRVCFALGVGFALSHLRLRECGLGVPLCSRFESDMRFDLPIFAPCSHSVKQQLSNSRTENQLRHKKIKANASEPADARDRFRAGRTRFAICMRMRDRTSFHRTPTGFL